MVVKKFELLALISIAMLISFNSVHAQKSPLTLSVNQDVYFPGDNILIYADVHNINPQPTYVVLENSLSNEKGTYPTAYFHSEFQLNANEDRKVLLYDISVDENFISDEYIVNSVLLFDGEELTSESMVFTVEDTKEEMEISIETCKDRSCSEESKVFVQDENVYLFYSSDADNPSVTATLTHPDGTTRTLNLPESVRAEQIGTYVLDVTASKQGYKTASVKEQFGVIEKEAEIRSESACNGNGVCDQGENWQNCPQDCERPEGVIGVDYFSLLLYVAAAIVLIVLLILIVRHFRKEEPPDLFGKEVKKVPETL